MLAGGMTPAAREAAMAVFARDPERPLMLLSLQAGGVGLNLTAASAVVHFDRWWNPAVEAQAEDRAHRIGQTRPVRTVAYLCPDTIEERIAAILADKRALSAELVDGVSVSSLRHLDLPTLLRAVGV
jgi:SNF2 family DNA or RNA helicase